MPSLSTIKPLGQLKASPKNSVQGAASTPGNDNPSPAPITPAHQALLSKVGEFIKSLGEDALGTLVVKPATRATEAGLSAIEPLLPKQAQQKIETKLQEPVKVLGVTVPPQRTGVKGAVQIAGDAAKSASYLYGGEGLGELGQGASLGQKIIQGAKVGAAVGGLAGAGNELENPNTTAGSVLKAGGKGVVAGGVLGGAIPAIAEGVSKVISPKTAVAPEEEALSKAYATSEQAQKEFDAAKQARLAAAERGTNAVQTINEKASGYKTSIGQKFASDAAKLEKANPDLRLNLTNDQIDSLNALKESKSFSLPDSITKDNVQLDSGTGKFGSIRLTPEAQAEIEAAGKSTQVSLTPTQAQDLIKELNSSTYKEMADGSLMVDHQRIGVTNEIKKAASEAFGQQWDSIYSKYAQGRSALEQINNFVNLKPNASAAELNKQLEGISKLTSTPEGKLFAKQALGNFQSTSKIDLTDPVKMVQDIAEHDNKLDAAEGKASTAQKDLEKARQAVNDMQAQKLSTPQKITKLLKARGARWSDYALRYILIRELFKAVNSK